MRWKVLWLILHFSFAGIKCAVELKNNCASLEVKPRIRQPKIVSILEIINKTLIERIWNFQDYEHIERIYFILFNDRVFREVESF